MSKNYPEGSISWGTMREEDLIPVFCDELETLASAHDREDHLSLVEEIRERIANEPEYFESDGASFDLNESLFDALNEYAAPGWYFGAHPGDGSDYGFWEEEV